MSNRISEKKALEFLNGKVTDNPFRALYYEILEEEKRKSDDRQAYIAETKVKFENEIQTLNLLNSLNSMSKLELAFIYHRLSSKKLGKDKDITKLESSLDVSSEAMKKNNAKAINNEEVDFIACLQDMFRPCFDDKNVKAVDSDFAALMKSNNIPLDYMHAIALQNLYNIMNCIKSASIKLIQQSPEYLKKLSELDVKSVTVKDILILESIYTKLLEKGVKPPASENITLRKSDNLQGINTRDNCTVKKRQLSSEEKIFRSSLISQGYSSSLVDAYFILKPYCNRDTGREQDLFYKLNKFDSDLQETLLRAIRSGYYNPLDIYNAVENDKPEFIESYKNTYQYKEDHYNQVFLSIQSDYQKIFDMAEKIKNNIESKAKNKNFSTQTNIKDWSFKTITIEGKDYHVPAGVKDAYTKLTDALLSCNGEKIKKSLMEVKKLFSEKIDRNANYNSHSFLYKLYHRRSSETDNQFYVDSRRDLTL
ncbi:hypothetical protein PsalN5692_02919 [Piscirickettsia salmonis]|uniref:hypothetical protein n=1 Tax=Piscirickettsia salmonis TaxID=1238 RepID=UPI0012B98CA7|nr:hypothetical protein [Piscirickettsia salmonis]QGP51436.1 hypothetical protein PsalN5692_02919 [Piscirickettsia salmonis]